MPGTGRYMKLTAQPGRGGELAEALRKAADSLRHTALEEVDDNVRDVRPLDAIRVAPSSMPAPEAGPDGLEFVVFGMHHRGDVVVDRSFWSGT